MAVLALLAGPVASAMCSPGVEVASGAPGHEMPEHPAPGHGSETPPCHGAPADDEPAPGKAPAPSHDCASACCAAEVPAVPTEAPLPALTLVQAIVLDAPAPVAPAKVRTRPREAPPPESRRHALLQRFLI